DALPISARQEGAAHPLRYVLVPAWLEESPKYRSRRFRIRTKRRVHVRCYRADTRRHCRAHSCSPWTHQLAGGCRCLRCQPQYPAARFALCLGKFCLCSNFPDHRLAEETSTRCHICGLYGGPRSEREDLNVLSFERFKWGGVRHTNPLYCAFDLAQFESADGLIPTEEDYLILARIVQLATTLAPN